MDITRLKDALEGRYAIERELGEGGMATVYLAADLKHDRKVALKVLKPELAAVVGGDRFLAEIKTTANLQHPNILPLHDSGEADGFLYYVMPFIDGETLRERLQREQQLPVEEAVRIATEVAEALQAAHEQGVIHRDIKPANILLSRGRPLVADFGIALAVSAAGGGRLTETGLSVGTPYYMSPEQASADRDPTASSDVYSIACVLFEMLVGEPPHTGASAQAVLAKILTEDARAARDVRHTVPPHVDAAIRKALERLPADRFGSASDFAAALVDPRFRHGHDPSAAVAAAGPWQLIGLVASSAVVVLLFALFWTWTTPSPAPLVARFNIALPPDEGMAMLPRSGLALAPDGESFVYVGPASDGRQQLWLRPIGELNARPIPDTEGALNPFYSPDGSRIGFTVGESTLRIVPVEGGLPVTIVDSIVGSAGSTWSSDGYVYADGFGAVSLYRVPAGGGVPVPASTLDSARGETNHTWPDALPNGRGILFTVGYGGGEPLDIAVLDLSTGNHRVLKRGVYARYSPTGHVLYVTADGTLMVVPFDQEALEVTGEELAVARDLDVRQGGATDLTIADVGTVMYTTRASLRGLSELVWVDREGSSTVIEQSAALLTSPALSPDGTRVAVGSGSFWAALEVGNARLSNVWIRHLEDGTFRPLTLQGGGEPAWTPDGESVAFASDRVALLDLFVKRVDGTAEAELLLDTDEVLSFVSYSRDGEWIAYWASGSLYVRPIGDDNAEPVLLGESTAGASVSFSPDGRWVAFGAGRADESQIFVRPFPSTSTARWLVGEGTNPVWGQGGDEIFYRGNNGFMVAASVETEPTFSLRSTEDLFRLEDYVSGFDVGPDDQKFVMVRQLQRTSSVGSLVISQGFFEELKERVAN